GAFPPPDPAWSRPDADAVALAARRAGPAELCGARSGRGDRAGLLRTPPSHDPGVDSRAAGELGRGGRLSRARDEREALPRHLPALSRAAPSVRRVRRGTQRDRRRVLALAPGVRV